MKSIGLMAAMTLERDALVRYAKGWKRLQLGAFACQSNELFGHYCILITSGMGAKRAEQAARNLVELASVACLISFGIAGAVEEELAIGDVILADEACQLEDGVPGKRLALQNWSQEAIEAAEQAINRSGKHLYRGSVVTTGGAQISIDQLAGFRHPVLEMETMGIALVAAEKGVPLLAVRAISDGPCAPIPFVLEEMMDENANMRLGRLFSEIMRHPTILPQLLQMRRNSIVAADSAAQALMGLLGQLHAGVGWTH